MSGRRLPVYIALDTSGSMRGEPIHSVNVGMQAMLASLRQNPFALESVHLSVITFDGKVTEILPMTALENVVLPEIVCPESGPTFLGEALHFICDKAAQEIKRNTDESKGDWRPLLFIMTDGKPSDTLAFNESIPRVKNANFASIIACAAGPKSVPDQLKALTETVVSLDTMDSHSFSSFFQWVSAAVSSGTTSVGVNTPVELPPPPPEVQLVL